MAMRQSANTTTIISDAGGWRYASDGYGDYRATNDTLGLRTRLKRTLVGAQADVASGRLQTRVKGEWLDRIDGRRG